MKKNIMKTFLMVIMGVYLALFGYVGSANAAAEWSQVASTCAVDESSASKYAVNAARFSFKSGQTGTITARCNVTNVGFLNNGQKFFQIYYRDTDGTLSGDRVRALLYKVHENGGISLVRSIYRDAELDSNICPPWNYFCNATGDQEISKWVDVDFNFNTYSYFVEIQVTRSESSSDHDPTISRINIHE